MANNTRFVGLDVHAETIAVAVAEGRERVSHLASLRKVRSCDLRRTAVQLRPHQQTEGHQVATSEAVVTHHGRQGGGDSGNEVRRPASTALRVFRTAIHDLPKGRGWSAGHAPSGDESATASTRCFPTRFRTGGSSQARQRILRGSRTTGSPYCVYRVLASHVPPPIST